MVNAYRFFLCALVLTVGGWTSGFAQTPGKPLRFRVTLATDVSPKGDAGRLFVLMTDSQKDMKTIDAGFGPSGVWIAAMEIEHLAPGGTVEFDPDRLAYPRPFSQAKRGTYQVMALLDREHTYAYHGRDADDLMSAVVKLDNIDPADSAPVELTLNRTAPVSPTPAMDNVTLETLETPLVSAFWGRPVVMRAGVVVPPSYATQPTRRYPTVYHVHGFGGDHRSAWREAPRLAKDMTEGRVPEMVHVYLDGSFPTGHHEFADSVNNGPWGRALTTEFIPHLEKKFRLVAKPYGRFLTGHSSGGWSTLWLQVTYPDFFGGTWSTSPDPVDLRSFTGIDVTPGSTDNAYRTRDGAPRNLVRMNGKDVATIEDFVRQEMVVGEYGGQFASFEWVWSPRGQDGRPMRIFRRESGDLDPVVAEAWRKYDIRLILEKNWETLGPKLRGKLALFCGGADTFHLNESFVLLRDFLKAKGSDAVVELVPSRDHFNLYQPYETYKEGLSTRIYKEMGEKFAKAAKGKK